MNPTSPVQSFTITQATSQIFRDLYVYNTMLILVEAGSKCVRLEEDNELDIGVGELLIFPSSTFITIENRITSGSDYRALCVSYPDEMIEAAFGPPQSKPSGNAAITIGKCPLPLANAISTLETVSESEAIPTDILQHRLMEPLIWLKSMGVELSAPDEKSLDCRLRDLIASEPSRKWRSQEVAATLGCSEATLRRRLSECSTTFSEILTSVRLEHGLTLLQTTSTPISQIALDCGYSTPSHFSDAFKGRFNIQPKLIRNS